MPVVDFRGPLNGLVTGVLRRLGFSGRRASASKREAWWWLESRGRSIRHRQGRLYSGNAVVFMPLGRVDLASVDVPSSGPGEVTVRMRYTAVSPGTERAQYLGLAGAQVQPGHVPGFSGVGEVLATGDGVPDLAIGDVVAVANCRHQSVISVPAHQAIRVPKGVREQDAAMIQLGVIALQGVALAEPEGRSVAVFGAGLIGTLAQRLSVVAGASSTTLIARSRRRFRDGTPPPGRFLAISEENQGLDAIRADIVIDATGDPRAIDDVVAAARPGGVVVLLGSSRGGPTPFPLDEVQSRGLMIIGAHVATASFQENRGDTGYRRRLGESFLASLSRRELTVADLVEFIADPREAELLYRRLAREGSFVGALFDWTKLETQSGLAAWARLPDVAARGIDFGAMPLARPTRTGQRRSSRAGRLPVRDRQLGIAVVGCGDIATLNAAAIAGCPSTELRVCCDTNAELAQDLAQSYGARATAELDEVLGSDDVDLVFLSVPHHLHTPLALRVIEAGKGAIVEKPPADRLNPAVELIDEAMKSGSFLTFCLPQRWESGPAEARRLMTDGAIGDLRGASVTFLADRPPGYFSGGLSGRTSSDWRSDPSRSGGGITIMNLSHQLDLLLWLIDHPVESVMANMTSLEGPRGIEDTASLSLRLAGGALAVVQGATHVRGTQHEEFRIWGDAGHLELSPQPQVFTLRGLSDYRVGRWQRLARPGLGDPRSAFLQAVGRAYLEGEPPPVTPQQALDLQAVIAAAYLSASGGRAVPPDGLIAEARGSA